MKDVLTDLNAEAEVLPLTPPREDWLGHKGMVQAAEYIRRKITEEGIITKALNKVNKFFSLHRFFLVFVNMFNKCIIISKPKFCNLKQQINSRIRREVPINLD